jgi:hypothetical protein
MLRCLVFARQTDLGPATVSLPPGVEMPADEHSAEHVSDCPGTAHSGIGPNGPDAESNRSNTLVDRAVAVTSG